MSPDMLKSEVDSEKEYTIKNMKEKLEAYRK